MSLASRVVIDTNVLVSASLIPGSVPHRAIKRAAREGTILLSEDVLQEFDDVIRRTRLNRRVPEADRLRLLADIVAGAETVVVTTLVTDCRDPDDNKFLELALDGRATCVVSGDADLLALHPFRGIPILTPQAFLDSTAAPPPDVV
jgi:uncharacterized protein